MFTKIPEIDVQALAAKLKTGENFILLDVREPWELDLVRLTDERLVNLPLSAIQSQGRAAFPEGLRLPETELIVICHHGVRSANVTGWLLQQGWKNAVSVAGGMAAYAEEIDPAVGTY